MKVNNSTNSAVPYAKLEINEEQKGLIRKYAHMGANITPKDLALNSPGLIRAKNQLNGINPLKWLEFMLNDPPTLQNLKSISQSEQRWNGIRILGIFFKGFKPRTAGKLRACDARGQITPYLSDFIKSLKLKSGEANTVMSLAKEKKWEEMIQCLVDLREVGAPTYQEMSADEKAQVKNLIRMVANDSIPSLIGQLSQLMAAKRKLYKIHPLRSFEFMLNDPDTVKNLGILSKTPERWVGVPFFAPNKGFKPQSAEKFRTYHAQGDVLPHLPEFIKSIGLKQKQAIDVSQLAHAGKWSEMIQYLLESKTQS